MNRSKSVLLKSGIFSLLLVFLNFLRLLNFAISWSLQSRLPSADQFFLIDVCIADPPTHFPLLAFPAQTFKNCTQHTPEISVSAWGESSKSPVEKKPCDHEAFLSISAWGGTRHAGDRKHGTAGREGSSVMTCTAHAYPAKDA